MGLLIGVDIGGTKLSAVLVDEAAQVRDRTWLHHGAGDHASVLAAIRRVVDECRDVAAREGDRVVAVGLAVAGWLSRDRAHLVWGANIATRGVNLRSDLEAALGLPVVIDNDGNATALAEYRLGAGRSSRVLALFTLGTGLGGGVIIDGRPLIGGRGLAGELGHIGVADPAPLCVCGGFGCAELYASGRGLVAQYASELDLRGPESGEPLLTESAAIVAAAYEGRSAATAVIRTAALALASAIRALAPVIDPDLILIGGTVGHSAGALLIPIIEEDLRRRSLAAVGEPPRIAMAELGPGAGALGAAELARDHVPATAELNGQLIIQGEDAR